jgi:hypothetical protein
MHDSRSHRKHLGLGIRAIGGLLFCAAAASAAEQPDVLNNIRLASRMHDGRIFIQGGPGANSRVWEGLPRVPGQAGLYRDFFLRITPDYLAGFRTGHVTKWKIGDKWKIYTGAGGPLTVVIQEFVLQDNYASAIARFEDNDAANLVEGLRATEYLAAPTPGIPEVSR